MFFLNSGLGRRSTRFAWEVGTCDVVFEGDSNIVSNVILGYITPLVTIANVIEGIQQLMEVFKVASRDGARTCS